MNGPEILPIFPLGTVALPGVAVPLHIFEPRYRAMMADLTSGSEVRPEFGIVLIERGSEVGGGDQRADVGAVAAILDHEKLEDGRWLVVAVAVERFRVVEWLLDDPYPRAHVERLAPRPWVGDRAPLDAAVTEVRRARELAASLAPADAGAEVLPLLPADPVEAIWRLAALTPLGSYDRQVVLRKTIRGGGLSFWLDWPRMPPRRLHSAKAGDKDRRFHTLEDCVRDTPSS